MRKLFFILTLVLMFACEKDDEQKLSKNTLDDVKENFMPLAIGNYWVYENYHIDSLKQEKKLDFIDSIGVNRDTVIDGVKFYILSGLREFPGFDKLGDLYILRDSLGYLINELGEISFSSSNFNDILHTWILQTSNNDTLLKVTYKMFEYLDSVEILNNKYKVLNYQGNVTVYNSSTNDIWYRDYTNKYYASNVGVVYESFFYIGGHGKNNDYYVRRLKRYNVSLD